MLNQSSTLYDRAPNKRQLAEQAIALALQGRWEEAVTVNRRLLTFYPNEADALNRLGKALTELRRYAEARDAYAQAIQADPGNSIARRNLERLQVLPATGGDETRAAPTAEKIEPRLFVEEPGKTVVTTLLHPASPETLARVNAGDLVTLSPSGRSLQVMSAAGEPLGEVEPKLAHRLIHFMQVGNLYIAAVKSLNGTGQEVRILIRETARHASLAGRASFPTRAETGHRGYTRDSLFRYELEGDEDEEEDGEGDYVERERHDEDAEEEETTSLVHDLDRGFELERDEE